MATHSSTLAWKIPWTEEPGRLQSMGSLRVGHDWTTSLSLTLTRIGEGNGNPLQCSCLENPRNGGAWWAAIYGVAQSRTRLKRLSSSSSNRWGNWNSGEKKKGYLSQVTPSTGSWAKMWKTITIPPRSEYFLRRLLFLNRWWVSSGSFVPLLISKLWLQLPLFPLCQVSIWLCNFYLPAFVLDIMIRQHLIWSLVLIYFSGADPRDQLKGTTQS